MRTIYKPRGAAAEYGDYAVNIYTGCPHRCYYCFAPNVLHREREVFHSCVEPRKDIVAELRRQLEREKITGKLNYHPSEIDWAQFGRNAETVCKGMGLDYYIKDSLRAEMEKL